FLTLFSLIFRLTGRGRSRTIKHITNLMLIFKPVLRRNLSICVNLPDPRHPRASPNVEYNPKTSHF
ncbi:MAG TPA: hypothetical protein PK941_09660, partial [Paludibacter sp.]|nr:hypothetical protein [Paludibacter sp.]